MQHLWRKTYGTISWITLSAVSLVLLIASVRHKNNKVCKGFNVEIIGTENNFFVDKKEVTDALTASGTIKGEPLANINLLMLENRLKKNKWIAKAELFFDNNEVLQVVVKEKNPVARIFTTEGSSFYIDSSCRHLPLSNKLSARVPMFTNFPTDRVKLSRPDSALMASVKELAMFIQADDFWKAQVAQIDITPDGFEMVPTIGNHVVQLSNGEDYKEKFERLFSFYKQVWTKVGFEKYEKIAVQFKGQVIATKRGSFATRVDSAKAMEALNDLLAKTHQANEESVDSNNETELENITVDKQPLAISESEPATPVKQQPKTAVINEERHKKKLLVVDKAITKADVKRAVKKTQAKKDKKSNKRQRNVKAPKAVMKKR
jgi:cell division protein FtsQ